MAGWGRPAAFEGVVGLGGHLDDMDLGRLQGQDGADKK